MGTIPFITRALVITASLFAQSSSIPRGILVPGEIEPPYWLGRHLFAITWNHPNRPGMAHFYVLEPSRATPLAVPIDIPEATSSRTMHVIPRGESGFLVALQSTSPQSAAAGTIAFVSLTGKVERIVRTNPFVPQRLTIDETGQIWALGYELGHGSAYPDQHVLWRYSAEGVFVSKHLTRGSIGDRRVGHPAMPSNEGAPELYASRGRIYLFNPSPTEWWTLNRQGEVEARQPVSRPGDRAVNRLTMSQSGGVFASFVGAPGVFQLTGEGKFVAIASAERATGPFVGVQGDRLVRFEEIPAPPATGVTATAPYRRES